MSHVKTTAGRVALVGAGPGDPELITVRGLELLLDCDALVYDNLMADAFVALSRAEEKIFVGKSAGRHALPQEEISALLVRLAKEGKRVVRLKGGDPFVFGRGGEEAQACVEAGVPYEVVPGVTSALGGSAYAGIPVTHRELSRGVTLVTGHFARDREVELPWEALAKLNHTLVFYMAMAATEQIIGRLMSAGLPPSTPAAVLERATTGAARTIVADAATIAAEAKKAGVQPPGLLVIGEVASLRETLAWRPEMPLAGRGVLFTRAAESQYDAISRLRALGAEVLDVPVVEAVERADDPAVRRAIDALAKIQAVVFTSAIAVESFFSALAARGRDVRALAGIQAAAGSRTVVRALAARGLIPDIVPDVKAGRDLAATLVARLPQGARVLLPRSSSADQSFPATLEKGGLAPLPFAVYDTRPLDLSWLDVKLAHWNPDAVVFLSGSTIGALLSAAPGLVAAKPLWACVGRKTAESLATRGLMADLMPERPDVDVLVDALASRLAQLK
ncbi:MAG: uroporphyrinogen-III C-methyltransferase [Myxococcales bacterium]|nr:MAG: uroporphyrinogen-III C-methyltransferase [Myxococcales bacterium]